MSDFHKQKAEKKKSAKLIFSAESLEQWKEQQRNIIKTEALAELNEKIENANQLLKEREEYVNQQENIIKRDACSQAFILLMGIPLKIVRDDYGFGLRKRLPRFAERIIEEYQVFVDSGMDITEYREFLKDDIGLGFALNDVESEDDADDRTETVESV